MDGTEGKGCEGLLEGLKANILRVVGGQKLQPLEMPSPVFSKNDRITDVPTEELVYLAAPLISAISMADADPQKASELADAFLHELSLLQAVPTGCIRAWQCARAGSCSRDDRLLLIRAQRSFSADYPEWDDRGWLLRLLKCLFCRAVSTHLHCVREAAVQKACGTPDEEVATPGPATHCYRICAAGRPVPVCLNNASQNPVVPPGLIKRAELLKRSGGPTLSLEEYADMELAAMERREASKAEEVRGLEDSSNSEPSGANDGLVASRAKLMQEDEAADQRRCNLGNTKRMG